MCRRSTESASTVDWHPVCDSPSAAGVDFDSDQTDTSRQSFRNVRNLPSIVHSVVAVICLRRLLRLAE